MKKQESSWFIYFAAFSINFVIFASGICYSWTSPFIPKFESSDPSINPISRPVTISEAGLLVSIINLGLLFGPIIPALLGKKLGKKKTLLLSATPLLVAHIICSMAKTINMFLFARFLMGVASGATWSLTPTYTAEISEPKNRGLLGSLMATMSSSGNLFAYCIGPLVSMKWFSILNLIPVLVFFVFLIFFVPESPYDLIKKKDFKKAEHSLVSLRRKSNVHSELAEIKKFIESESVSDGKFFDLFRSRNLIKAMIVSVGAMVMIPLSGIVAILGYTQTIFEMSGSSIPSAYSAIIVMSVAVLTTIIHTNLVDRMGRKILITTSCGIMFISMSSLGAFFYLKENNFDVVSLGWLPLCSLILYMIGYFSGVAAVPYIIVGEVFPPNVKVVAASLCTSSNFTLSFISTLVFPYLFDNIGFAFTFWLFSVFLALGFIFCVAVVPETKGKSLQEITQMLGNSNKT